jgi:hypothetical protein
MEDIGLFYPDYPTPDKTRPTIEADGKTYIRDVHYFIARAEDLLGRKDELVVRLNISACLRGEAQTWYMSLSDLERDGLRGGSRINNWRNSLVKQFAPNPTQAMQELTGNKLHRYTLTDAAEGRSVTEWFANFCATARNAGIDGELQQIAMVYSKLDLSFQRDVPRPTPTTRRSDFTNRLDEMRHVW